ncbi:hypothetical protein EVAR_58752_1 [Eumeta japonica]|uniref:Uncharacterized protein n=1 Tax=Eumeta variegata TaxID=151549 RepID=A0A4C1ZFL9_EUMVA|nr:hypothetical protein EVAR_58752_1 [Eumeta japonica]
MNALRPSRDLHARTQKHMYFVFFTSVGARRVESVRVHNYVADGEIVHHGRSAVRGERLRRKRGSSTHDLGPARAMHPPCAPVTPAPPRYNIEETTNYSINYNLGPSSGRGTGQETLV